MTFLFRLKRRINWERHKLQDLFLRKICRPPKVMSFEDTVDYILENKVSMSRYGDGELGVIYGGSLGFQDKNPVLGKRLKDVLEKRTDGLLLCIPDVFANLNRFCEIDQNFWRSHLYFNRRRWYKSLDKKNCYGSAFVSRFYSTEFNTTLADKRITKLKKLWDNRDVVFIEGSQTKMGVGNDLFSNAKSIRRILCPAKGAFDKYTEILEAVTEIPVNEDALFILALGPTATVMAADLAVMGYQALDMGHIDIEYEWYRKRATKKIPVTGKFCNESYILGLSESEVTGELKEKHYDKQVIKDLS